ncbi:MAG: DEAD/DEAH box helicase family protein [Synergistaceae bacterium]|jgi:hypothetical protein|nr:DEAD/DEAH box helicase family protein [Synergistaceae bacterium]
MVSNYDESNSFYEQLHWYYTNNRGKIRRNYKDLTRKFLDHNDKETNQAAYLRKPQFEALEMYVFIKEFMNNAQVYSMFDDWRNRRDKFADASYYSVRRGQVLLFDDLTEKMTDTLFKQMRKYSEKYSNYIYALTMGLGKTILMATCIFYEFLLAHKYPKDERFCHNALVFAPDRTVLQSLKEIITFDKTLVVPKEYARVLDANIKFHFLEDSGTTLNTLDNSDFNIVISNTQKIIVKKKRKEEPAANLLFRTASPLLSTVYGAGDDEDDIQDENDLKFNQRFMKLCRLSQLGVYVDEAHHLFGADLEKQLRANTAQTSLRSTINMLAADLERHGTNVIACYNYTGTPYVNNQLLPEVVYAYGLKESISNGFLKEADVIGFENVKSREFLRVVITKFWERYGANEYEELLPKLAFFASTVKEADEEVRPMVEDILSDLDIPISKILVNVGDDKITKADDIRNFNNLDVPATEGSKKQFLILVGKGREGWNCRSLFGVALFRSPQSKIFVLQATMRCLRKITDEQTTATVFLSKENFDTLNDELNKNFNMEIKDLKESSSEKRQVYKVRVLPPARYITVKRIWHEYSLLEKGYVTPVDFGLKSVDTHKYEMIMYEKRRISKDMSVKETAVSEYKDSMRYSAFTLAGEIARYLNISGLLASRIIRESVDGADYIVDLVSRFNEILDDIIIPKIFDALFEVRSEKKTEERELKLLREPKEAGYYEFSAKPDLVVFEGDSSLRDVKSKSFHADTYCFDSKPEKECFLQYITSDKVKEVYFTGMFTSNQGDISISYYDTESGRLRHYYPDFLAKMSDGTYQLIEVKGDDKIEDVVVKAKAEAAIEIAVESDMVYKMYAGSAIMKTNILDQSRLITE